jgi:flagellar hook-basal body complex protein FliE
VREEVQVSLVQGVNGVAGAGGGLKPSPSAPETPFAGVFKGMVAETNDLSSKAQQAVTGLLSGSGVDVHEALIATQKADIAFELALEVRNKAVGAYQQMMSMQF